MLKVDPFFDLIRRQGERCVNEDHKVVRIRLVHHGTRGVAPSRRLRENPNQSLGEIFVEQGLVATDLQLAERRPVDGRVLADEFEILARDQRVPYDKPVQIPERAEKAFQRLGIALVIMLVHRFGQAEQVEVQFNDVGSGYQLRYLPQSA